MSKFTTKKLKNLLVNDLLRQKKAVLALMDRHDGFLPSGYYKKAHWYRDKKVKLNAPEEQGDKIDYEPLDEPTWQDFYLEYKPVTYPCTCRVFVCSLREKQYDAYEEDDPNIPDDVCLVLVTDEADEEILAITFNAD